MYDFISIFALPSEKGKSIEVKRSIQADTKAEATAISRRELKGSGEFADLKGAKLVSVTKDNSY